MWSWFTDLGTVHHGGSMLQRNCSPGHIWETKSEKEKGVSLYPSRPYLQ